MKIVIIGGHFTPALAVIEAMPKDTKIIYIGRKYTFEKDTAVSLEYQTITKRGILFENLITGRLQRKFTPETIPSLLKIPKGFFHALHILKQYKPDVIVGFGGYLSVPVCLAGKILGIPIIIHEQTLEAGLANKLISHIAQQVCISWPSSEKFFPKKKTVLTGNPLPGRMLGGQLKSGYPLWPSGYPSNGGDKALYPLLGGVPGKAGWVKVSNDPLICIVGGSSGSHAINVLIEGCLTQLLEKYTIIHQTGDSQEFHDFERLTKMKATLPQGLQKRYTIITFIKPEHFISVLQEADLVVSRSGINTVTTLLLLQKNSLLIPLPISQRNEQYKNACLMKDAGLGDIVDQRTITSEQLFDKIGIMLNNKRSYEKNISKTQKAQTNAAAQKIVAIINNIYQGRSKKKKESYS